MRPERRLHGGYALLAVIVLAVAGYHGYRYAQLGLHPGKAWGIVAATDRADFAIEYDVAGATYYIEEARPENATGDVHVGERVLVEYDRSDPARARWGDSRSWIFPLAMLLLGVLAAVLALSPRARRATADDSSA